MNIARIVSSLVLLAVVVGCAPRTVVPPAAPGAPRHPEFVFPAAVDALPARLLEEHQAAWQTLQAGDARGAERRYGALLKRAPDFYPAHAGLGYVAVSRNNLKAAIGHFEQALAGNPAYAPALAGKGQAHLALGERGPALASFDAALAADPGLTGIRSAADVLRFQVLQGGVAEARKAAEAGQFVEARTGYQAALAASPQSPFLHRELALVELKDGQLPAALEHAQQAVTLEPGDARNLVALADVLEASGDSAAALETLTKAVAIEPSETLDSRIEALRARATMAAMPAEFQAIETAPAITRAQLAALIGTRLEPLVAKAPTRAPAIMNDTRGNWAAGWILPVARAGFMEVYPNHTFQPGATVRRGELASAVSRILAVIGAGNPRLAAAWSGARPRFTDLPPANRYYPAASVAVAAGVIAPLENDTFQWTRAVSGQEAIAAIDRLAALADTRR